MAEGQTPGHVRLRQTPHGYAPRHAEDMSGWGEAGAESARVMRLLGHVPGQTLGLVRPGQWLEWARVREDVAWPH
jgi:hypothetical protein